MELLNQFELSEFWFRFLVSGSQCCIVQLRFGTHGASPFRLDHLRAQESCRCHRQTCFQRLGEIREVLLQFLSLFWSLAKHIQDEYIRVTTTGEKGDSYKDWYLLGKRFSRKCCLAILGLGNCRFNRVREGRFDRRYTVWGGVPLYVFHSYVLLFLFV